MFSGIHGMLSHPYSFVITFLEVVGQHLKSNSAGFMPKRGLEFRLPSSYFSIFNQYTKLFFNCGQ